MTPVQCVNCCSHISDNWRKYFQQNSSLNVNDELILQDVLITDWLRSLIINKNVWMMFDLKPVFPAVNFPPQAWSMEGLISQILVQWSLMLLFSLQPFFSRWLITKIMIFFHNTAWISQYGRPTLIAWYRQWLVLINVADCVQCSNTSSCFHI